MNIQEIVNQESQINPSRRREIEQMALQLKGVNQDLNIAMICTHNSRRSVFAEIWANIAKLHYQNSNVHIESAGTESTNVYQSVIEVMKAFDVRFKAYGSDGQIKYKSDEALGLNLYSKTIDEIFPDQKFVAIMTCDHADQNCPYIPEVLLRLKLTYRDPKFSDGTIDEKKVYTDKSIEIGREIFYLFKCLSDD